MHDVTTALRQGTNALGVSLANGFAATPGNGYVGWYGRSAPPRVLLQCPHRVRRWHQPDRRSPMAHGNGTSARTPSTISGWARRSTSVSPRMDGNSEGYADSAWFAAISSNPGGALFARTVAPVKVLETASPTSINGNLFQFDHLATGWLRLKTSGNAGDTVTVLQRGDFPPDSVVQSADGRAAGRHGMHAERRRRGNLRTEVVFPYHQQNRARRGPHRARHAGHAYPRLGRHRSPARRKFRVLQCLPQRAIPNAAPHPAELQFRLSHGSQPREDRMVAGRDGHDPHQCL